MRAGRTAVGAVRVPLEPERVLGRAEGHVDRDAVPAARGLEPAAELGVGEPGGHGERVEAGGPLRALGVVGEPGEEHGGVRGEGPVGGEPEGV